MTISSSEIRRNMTIILDGELYSILDWQHRQAPKAPPTLTMKVRQIRTGNVYERKVQGNQKLSVAQTERRMSQYLYRDGDLFYFMDNETYEQFPVIEELLGDYLKYLMEGDTIEVLIYENNPVQVELPAAVNLTIEHSEPGLRGDTQSGATKPATTSTGLTLQVPLFINAGDSIKVDTRNGGYLERVG